MLLLAALLYIPTLRTGFLTDDFLDCTHTLREMPTVFSSEYGGGYRPLMILSWSLDNKLWGIENQAGWHASNLLILAVSSLLVYLLLGRFLSNKIAIFAGTSLFVFSYPMAVAIARVSWRTTVLALIPFLASLILVSIWSGDKKRKCLPYFVAFLYLISLLLKETAIAAVPVIAMVAYCSSSDESRRKNAIWSVVIGLFPLVIYGALRYRAMGLGVNYAESKVFGFFIIRNILLQNAIVWQPWLSDISARILFLIYPVFVYFGVPGWKNRILVFSMGIFLLLPVGNLVLRPDLAVAALPGAALFLGFVVQRLHGKRILIPLLAVLFAAVILYSRDEVKTLGMASDYVQKTTGRIAEIADGLPDSGPVFISGVGNSVGVYGTFWPGEYMVPMQCMGIQPGRLVAGTDRIWESLLDESSSGFLVFLSEDGASSFSVPVSVDSYAILPDSVVVVSGAVQAGELVMYPSCSARDESTTLVLVSSLYRDSVITVFPEVIDEEAVFDLASVPEWLVADENTVIMAPDSTELTFFSENIALNKARRILVSKSEVSSI